MKFNVGDYLADTMHLSTFQHGIYVLLIMHCFKRGSLPNDERALMRIAKVPSVLVWRNESRPVTALFRVLGDELRHGRIDAERARAQELSEIKSRAGSAGARRRWDAARGGQQGAFFGALEDQQPTEIAQKPNGKCHPFAILRARESEPTATKQGVGVRTPSTPKQESPPNLPASGEASVVSIHARKGSREDGA
jgi:uncharacterized protein YdaU (DUF1376 family)